MKSDSFPIWGTVKIGFQGNSDEFEEKMRDAGCGVTAQAKDVLVFSGEEKEALLVFASVSDLGFRDGATVGGVFSRAERMNLKLCPPEVGPQLRLAYNNQPEGQRVIIAHEPLIDSLDCPLLFSLKCGHGGFKLLGTTFGYPDYCYSRGDLFVFLHDLY